jgi:hypothetical protein
MNTEICYSQITIEICSVIFKQYLHVMEFIVIYIKVVAVFDACQIGMQFIIYHTIYNDHLLRSQCE